MLGWLPPGLAPALAAQAAREQAILELRSVFESDEEDEALQWRAAVEIASLSAFYGTPEFIYRRWRLKPAMQGEAPRDLMAVAFDLAPGGAA